MANLFRKASDLLNALDETTKDAVKDTAEEDRVLAEKRAKRQAERAAAAAAADDSAVSGTAPVAPVSASFPEPTSTSDPGEALPFPTVPAHALASEPQPRRVANNEASTVATDVGPQQDEQPPPSSGASAAAAVALAELRRAAVDASAAAAVPQNPETGDTSSEQSDGGSQQQQMGRGLLSSASASSLQGDLHASEEASTLPSDVRSARAEIARLRREVKALELDLHEAEQKMDDMGAELRAAGEAVAEGTRRAATRELELQEENGLLRSAKETDRAAMASALQEKEAEVADLAAALAAEEKAQKGTQQRLDTAREEQKAAAEEKEQLLSELATARSRTDQSAEVSQSEDRKKLAVVSLLPRPRLNGLNFCRICFSHIRLPFYFFFAGSTSRIALGRSSR